MDKEETRLAHCSKIIGDLRFMLPLILTLFGGTLYGNSDTVKQWVHGKTVIEADGQTEVIEGGMTFEESVVKHSQEVRTELDQIKQDIIALQARSSSKDGRLQQQITKWHGTD